MTTEQLMMSIVANAEKHLIENEVFIECTEDVMDLADAYTECCASPIIKDLSELQDVGEAEAALEHMHIRAVWTREVIEFYLEELGRIKECRDEEKKHHLFKHLRQQDNIPDTGVTS